MDYAFLSKEGRGSQVVMEKAEGSGDQHVSETDETDGALNWFLYESKF